MAVDEENRWEVNHILDIQTEEILRQNIANPKPWKGATQDGKWESVKRKTNLVEISAQDVVAS